MKLRQFLSTQLSPACHFIILQARNGKLLLTYSQSINTLVMSGGDSRIPFPTSQLFHLDVQEALQKSIHRADKIFDPAQGVIVASAYPRIINAIAGTQVDVQIRNDRMQNLALLVARYKDDIKVLMMKAEDILQQEPTTGGYHLARAVLQDFNNKWMVLIKKYMEIIQDDLKEKLCGFTEMPLDLQKFHEVKMIFNKLASLPQEARRSYALQYVDKYVDALNLPEDVVRAAMERL